MKISEPKLFSALTASKIYYHILSTAILEEIRELVGMQPGDVPVTYADSKALEEDYGFTPKIGIREGLRNFAQWYKADYIL